MKSKAAPEKTAPKVKVKPKGNPNLIPPAMRLFVKSANKEEAIQVKDWAVKASTKHGVTPAVATALLGQIKGGAEEPVDEYVAALPPDQKKKANKAFNAIMVDWKVHVENRDTFDKAELKAKADAKEAREAAEVAKIEDKKESLALMTAADNVAGKMIAKASGVVDKTITDFLGDKLMIGKSGMIVRKKDCVLTKEDYATVLAGFDVFNRYGEAIIGEASAREAQVAVLAKQTLPETWQNLYEERPRALARVKKYMKVYEDLKAMGLPVYGNINSMRKAQEIKVSTDKDTAEEAKAKNLAAKKKVVEQVISLKEKSGKDPTQAEIVEIVNKVKREAGVKKILRPQCIFIILDDDNNPFPVGGAMDDKRLLSVSQISVTNKMTVLVLVDGVLVEKLVGPPSDAQNAYIDKLIAQTHDEEPTPVVNGKEAKKSVTETKGKAKKKAEPEPEEDEEEDEEPIEGEEEEEENTELESGETEEEEETESEETEEEEE